MLQALASFLSTSDFMPHGHCYLWRPALVSLHAGSDALIGTAYLVIAMTLWGLVRKIRLPFSPMIVAFGTFIGACGLTHYMEVWTLWEPEYWISGAVKLLTAIASLATGAYLVQARPTISRVAGSAQLAEERRIELETKNRELERLYAHVKELDDARTRFFANASHELRTPLALVLGAIEKALGHGDPAGARRELEVARRNARALLRHVNDLLDAARIEAGRMPVRYADADLARMARETAAQFELAAEERRVGLSVTTPPTLPAQVDAGEVQRVIANLLGNAFQFVPQGGRVALTVTADGDHARIDVDDSGPGVPEHLRSTIFERFRQDERLPRDGGAGLGLAIVKDLVELHGGSVEAGASDVGGARFTVHLPLRAPAGATLHPAATSASSATLALAEAARRLPLARPDRSAAASGPDAPTALVVDDNPDMARLVADALATEFHVTTAADGVEALRCAEALRPDVVVTDMMMPRMDGEALVRELRARDDLARTPVVVLTAREDEELRVRLLRDGAQDYVVKPVLADELRARARNLAQVKRSRDVLERELATRARDLEAAARELASRKRELELALDTARVARAQAERASQVKSFFLRMASHELRTPLTTIRLGVEALGLEREAPLTPRQREHVRRLDRAAARLLGLVESLLEYTRVESGRLLVQPERCDLVALAAEVIDEVLPQAQRKLLALELLPAPEVPPAETDPRLVRLVLLNLVVNAVKYTERGSIRVAVSRGERGHLVEVRDTGPGIGLEEQARIFEPFEQAGAAGGKWAGVGLGLSLVKGIVDALGGEITVASEPGAGATFRVLLPPRPPLAGAA